MSYEEWSRTVPDVLRSDPLWRREDYRLALYVADLGWEDVRRLARVRSTGAISDQLCRAVGSIGANIADGYRRASGADRARFYGYALGSAREARDWYHKSRHVLGPKVARHRLRVLTSVIRLLTATIPHERGMIRPAAASAPHPVAGGTPTPASQLARMHATSSAHPAATLHG